MSIRCKAKEITKALEHLTFSASSGWLNKFGINHDMSFKAISGRWASVNAENVSSFWKKCFSLIKDVHRETSTMPTFCSVYQNIDIKKGKICWWLISEREVYNYMTGKKEKLCFSHW